MSGLVLDPEQQELANLERLISDGLARIRDDMEAATNDSQLPGVDPAYVERWVETARRLSVQVSNDLPPQLEPEAVAEIRRSSSTFSMRWSGWTLLGRSTQSTGSSLNRRPYDTSSEMRLMSMLAAARTRQGHSSPISSKHSLGSRRAIRRGWPASQQGTYSGLAKTEVRLHTSSYWRCASSSCCATSGTPRE